MIELLNIDCMEYMRGLPDKSYDLAIVDPPYGIGASRGIGSYSRKVLNYSAKTDKKWDSHKPDKKYFLELFRVSKNQIIWGANYMTEFLPPSMGWVCWYKTDEIKGRSMSEIELAFTSFQIAARHITEKPFIRNGQRIHPTQKPVSLYKKLLLNYAKLGDRILDTHGGSFSHAIAAYNLGFDLTIMEADVDYFRDGKKSFDAHVAKYAPATEIPVNKKGQIKMF